MATLARDGLFRKRKRRIRQVKADLGLPPRLLQQDSGISEKEAISDDSAGLEDMDVGAWLE